MHDLVCDCFRESVYACIHVCRLHVFVRDFFGKYEDVNIESLMIQVKVSQNMYFICSV